MGWGIRTKIAKLVGRPRRRSLRARRFLQKGVSVDQFLSQLTSAGIRYAVLRWFDTLPEVAPGEDIDLLVADGDLASVEPLLTLSPRDDTCQKVDIYTESGIRGTSFRNVGYFCPELASRILANAVLLKGRYKVPSPADHFDSLAFHAVYHKGDASGLPRSAGAPVQPARSDHDYLQTLTELRPHATAAVELSLEGLDRYLSEKGLAPACDTLDRFQTGNTWLRERQLASRQDIGALAGLIVFVVRQAAVDFLPDITRTIDRYGLEVLRTAPLADRDRERVRRTIRGGNWGQGPFPRSGGDPATLIMAYDYTRGTETGPDGQAINRRGLQAKYAVRALIQARLPTEERFNPLHSSDNGWHSLHCLEALEDPALIDELKTQIDDIDQQLAAPWPEIKELNRGRRARSVIVDHPVHGQTVAKLFRPGARRFLEREIMARQELAGVALVPRLLEHGDNWILSPFFRDTHEHVRRWLRGTSQVQLTKAAIRSTIDFVHELRKRGLFLLDMTSHNLITDPRDGLLLLDFEFLQQYGQELPPLEQDYTVRGEAASDHFDGPVWGAKKRWGSHFSKSLFHPGIIGLSHSDLTRSGWGVYGALKMHAVLLWWYALARWKDRRRLKR